MGMPVNASPSATAAEARAGAPAAATADRFLASSFRRNDREGTDETSTLPPITNSNHPVDGLLQSSLDSRLSPRDM